MRGDYLECPQGRVAVYRYINKYTFIRPPHSKTPAAVITNKNRKFRSFNSKENIHKKAEDG